MKEEDPVFERNGKWFFWDETWAHEHGPFLTEKQARAEMKLYVNWLDGDSGHKSL